MRNPHRLVYDGQRGWTLWSLLKIATRAREFVPDLELHICIRENTIPASEDPQVVYSERQGQEDIAAGMELPFVREVDEIDYAAAGIWCCPTFNPTAHDGECAIQALRLGAIPIWNPIGVLREVFAGIPVYGIPALDPLVRTRYTYEIVSLLANPALQEQIRSGMMERIANPDFQKRMTILATAERIDGWMAPSELEWLMEHAAKMKIVAEIGCWKGRSTFAIAASCPGVVYAIDHWQGGKDEPEHIKQAAANDKVYREFLKNIKDAKNVVIVKRPSEEAAAVFNTKFLDMTFIDGDHGYDAVRADIRAWLPKTRRLIAGHDYNWPSVVQAVHAELGEVQRGPNAIWYKWIEKEAISNAAD